MLRGLAVLTVAAVASLAVPIVASAEEPPATAEIRSGEVPVRGPWVKVKVACILPEGSVCNGTIGMAGVSHVLGGARVAGLSVIREVSLLGGEERAVAIRLLPEVWKSVTMDRKMEARVSFRSDVGVVSKIIQLVPGKFTGSFF
jgi:hypothetical protein